MDYDQAAKELMDTMIQVRKQSLNKQLDNLSFGERKILAYLHYKNNGATAGELSEALHMSTPRIASALKSLAKKDFIIRERNVADKRIVIVMVTDEGRAFVEDERREAHEALTKLLKRLGPEDTQHFARIMKRIAEESRYDQTT